mmetsp:Transcript_12857/g.39946  ORF Transcript_12857/g.39946 Transcript_12857/m.39946 type:complete len:137 (-) Transcript_12857:60-470(-)
MGLQRALPDGLLHGHGHGAAASELPAGGCPRFRPAMLPKAACPNAIAEELAAQKARRAHCPPQPPSCCENARRAEAAAKRLEDALNSSWLLRATKGRVRQAGLCWWLSAFPAVPPLDGAGVERREGFSRAPSAGFL